MSRSFNDHPKSSDRVKRYEYSSDRKKRAHTKRLLENLRKAQPDDLDYIQDAYEGGSYRETKGVDDWDID